MVDVSQIKEHAEVIGADGGHIGTVDAVEGGQIKLTKNDSGAGGKHHYIPAGMIADIEDGTVRVSFNSTLAPEFWTTGEEG
jgi:hypothetical protein